MYFVIIVIVTYTVPNVILILYMCCYYNLYLTQASRGLAQVKTERIVRR